MKNSQLDGRNIGLFVWAPLGGTKVFNYQMSLKSSTSFSIYKEK